MSNPWFRLYSEIIDDWKIRALAFEDRWHYVAILCLKNSGELDKKPVSDKMMSIKLGVAGIDLENLKERLSDIGLVDSDWQPLAWDERQYKTDSSKERTRKYRERLKKKKGVTPCDVTVTVQDTDTDTDTESESYRTPTKFCPPDFYPNPDLLRTARFDRALCIEDELYKFKQHEFQTAKTDWERAFKAWLARANVPREKPNSETALRNINARIEEKYS